MIFSTGFFNSQEQRVYLRLSQLHIHLKMVQLHDIPFRNHSKVNLDNALPHNNLR